MISGGFINELSFLYLASGLIETSEDVESKPDFYIEVEKRGCDYHSGKKISRRVNNLKSEIDAFIKKYQSVHEKGRAKREALLRRTLAKAKKQLYSLIILRVGYYTYDFNQRSASNRCTMT